MNPKNKGNTFERKIAKILSDRFKDKTGISQAFRRNIDSGSFFGGRNQARAKSHDTSKATFGDITCPNDFLFSIECKHYKSAPLINSIIKQENGQWDKWLKQASQDCVNANLKLIVIVKYNLVDEFVFLENKLDAFEPMFRYKQYLAYTLEQVLEQPDSFFFSEEA